MSLLTGVFQFEYIKLGQIVPLETLSTEDLSQLEISYRSGRMVGRLKTRVTTCTVTIGQDKDSKLIAMMYEGEDAQKAWEHDFQYVSGIKEPGFAHLVPSHFPSPAHILTLPPDTEHTPVTSMQVEDLDDILRNFSWAFDDLVKKDLPNLPDGMRGLVEGLYLSQGRLGDESSPKEWDQVLQQLLHLLHVWGCEIDSEAGKKDEWKWVRVKDSGSIQELDDDSEDMSNTSPSHSSVSVEGSGTHKRKRNTSGSMEKQEAFAKFRANKRFKPASSKKQQLLKNARKRPGLQGKKLRGQ
ncbi:hypothetical protein VNI00_016860 [Paramarasmius palmivorus]|uniref:Uncharacterized protein n=1 Tax=Paramarasmius palmivorus TaxID=297713 RepID=A0AAW0B9P8_9AGAR